MKTIDDHNFQSIRALIRVDFNVPLDKEYQVTDDSRIRAAIPTIQKILKDGGSVVLMSHLGRPLKKLKEDGSVDTKKFTLAHAVGRLSELLALDVKFSPACIGDDALKLSSSLRPGEVLLLENLRFHKEEEKGDVEFARRLAAHGDAYVNDAFGTAHRAHASTTVVAQFFPEKKFFGYVMASELANARRIMEEAKHPFTAIIGGAKVSDKILLIENLLEKADHILIGGDMAYTFFRAMGGTTGNSLVEEDKIPLAKSLIEKAAKGKCRLVLPPDSITADAFDNDAHTDKSMNENIPGGWMGLDIGPQAVQLFSGIISSSKTILWNGPMGVFEMKKFEDGTKKIAEAIAAVTPKGTFSLIGGGDSAAAINKFGLADKVSFVSTGGGALLEYFEGKVLPGVAAIES